MKKRYAIVRVECPPKNEIDAQFVCFPKDNNCRGCRYGDTKEQLIRKIEYGIEIGMKKVFGKELDQTYYNRARKNHLIIAKEIVEFLGVEE